MTAIIAHLPTTAGIRAAAFERRNMVISTASIRITGVHLEKTAGTRLIRHMSSVLGSGAFSSSVSTQSHIISGTNGISILLLG